MANFKVNVSVLASAVFGAAGPLSAAAFRVGSAAADASDRIVYELSTGKLFYDADGSGAAAKVLFATLGAGNDLVAGDFVIG